MHEALNKEKEANTKSLGEKERILNDIRSYREK